MPKFSDRVLLWVTEDQKEWLDAYAESHECSISQAVRDVVKEGIAATDHKEKYYAQYKLTNRAELLNALDKNLEATLAALGMLSWFLPSFSKEVANDSNFLKYFGNVPPRKVYEVAQAMGSSLFENDSFIKAIRDIPKDCNLDTNEFAGRTRKQWEEDCTKILIKESETSDLI